MRVVNSAHGESFARNFRSRNEGRRPPASADCTMPTTLHANRIEVVHQALLQRRARRILDLGCGCGPLLQQLARDGSFERIVGVDASLEALRDCERQLLSQRIPDDGRISLRHMSFMAAPLGFETFDAAILVETIEHVPPHRLSIVEHSVFGIVHPGTVCITTPNKECNAVLGVPPQRLRHPDHKFEWTRAKFEAWSMGAAR